MTIWELTQHDGEVGMAQLPASASVPRWAITDVDESPFWSVTRTVDELCIISTFDNIPGTVPTVGPFTVFSIDGPLDHSLVGVLAGLLSPLADAGIPILTESTFDTDWILVPVAQADQAAAAWVAEGHHVDIVEPA